MCAEAGPWRCHRSLIADAQLVRGQTVCEIQSETKAGTWGPESAEELIAQDGRSWFQPTITEVEETKNVTTL